VDRIPDAASGEKRRDSTVGCFFLYLAQEGADRGFIVASFIAAIATAITIAEFFANGVAFASIYNWFHM
jgi:hypothetical protein